MATLVLALLPLSAAAESTTRPDVEAEESPKPEFSGWFLGGSSHFITGLETWGDDFGAGIRGGYMFERDMVRDGLFVDFTRTGLDAFQGRAELKLITAMAGYKAGIVVSERWFFYGGGGIGAAWADLRLDPDFNGSNAALSWQVFGGIEFRPAKVLSIRAGYRHLWVDRMSIRPFTLEGDDASMLEAGVTLWF